MKKIFLLMIVSCVFLLVGCSNDTNEPKNDLDLEDGFYYDKNDIYEDDIYLAATKDVSYEEKLTSEQTSLIEEVVEENENVNSQISQEEIDEIKEIEKEIDEDVREMLRRNIEMRRFRPRCMTPMVNKWRFRFH